MRQRLCCRLYIGALFAGSGLLRRTGASGRGHGVELYTSQGCSVSPADRIFEQIADRDDVIALALHVDIGIISLERHALPNRPPARLLAAECAGRGMLIRRKWLWLGSRICRRLPS